MIPSYPPHAVPLEPPLKPPPCNHRGLLVPLVSEMEDVFDEKVVLIQNAGQPMPRTLMFTRSVLCLGCGVAMDIKPAPKDVPK